MIKKNLNILVVFCSLVIFLFLINSSILAGAQDGPIIQINPITHTFPTAFEGEALSYDFVVSNRGSADLEIKDVTHQ
jgi:hypothetical protein